MNKIEYDIYCRWHDWLCGSFDVKPAAFIYLRVEPEVSYERIKKMLSDKLGRIILK